MNTLPLGMGHVPAYPHICGTQITTYEENQALNHNKAKGGQTKPQTRVSIETLEHAPTPTPFKLQVLISNCEVLHFKLDESIKRA